MSNSLKSLVVLGASAFGEVSEIIRDINQVEPTYDIIGILDDDENWHHKTVEGYPVLGPLNLAQEFEEAFFVLAVGSYRSRLARYDILQRLAIPNDRYATLIHPTAKVYSTSKVGYGCILFPGVVVFNDTTIEDFSMVLANSVIGVRNRLCEGAIVASLVSTSKEVVIGHYAHIGTGSCLSDDMKVGCGAQVAMGSLIFRDVPPGSFCFGNPQRFLDKVEVPEEIMEKWEEICKQIAPVP